MSTRHLFLFFTFLSVAGIVLYFTVNSKKQMISPIGRGKTQEKPLLAYTFPALQKTVFQKSTITLGQVIEESDTSQKQMVYFFSPSKPGMRPELKSSGVLNIPHKSGTYPLILMFRGFIPEESYEPGVGTQHVAEVLTKNGYITLAPDFLGFGESDKPSTDSFEARFQTYSTVLTLLKSLDNLNVGLDASYAGRIRADVSKVGIWGHSNGGHIALAVLSITGASIPSVLWAPVSQSFPYSMLYYSDEYDDQGKAMRKVLSMFEEEYNIDLFSPTNYYQWIRAPLEIEQGTSDQEVPVWWSQNLVDALKKEDIDVVLNTYSGADHNMLPGGWNSAVENTIVFFNKTL